MAGLGEAGQTPGVLARCWGALPKDSGHTWCRCEDPDRVAGRWGERGVCKNLVSNSRGILSLKEEFFSINKTDLPYWENYRILTSCHIQQYTPDRSVVLSWGWFCPPPAQIMLGKVWRHFCCHNMSGATGT